MENLGLSSGTVFAGRFEIEGPAGSGGMGTVYRARDLYSGELVALKLLRREDGRLDEPPRFSREAQLLAELHHPGIVSYIAHGRTPMGQPYLAMEWLDGEDLQSRLKCGPLLLRDSLMLVDQIASALAAAHQRGILHRDLKPSNVFLLGKNPATVKLLDFGIACRMDSSASVTRTGTMLGTPEYMAPEQARGSSDLSPAVDLFSLGCILYACLTGEPPFVADHLTAVLARILFEAPVPLSERRPGVPKSVAFLLEKLLAKDPADRPADAAQLRRELGAISELPEPALALTRSSSQPATEVFAEKEQSLLSVVLALPRLPAEAGSGKRPDPTVVLSGRDREALLQTLKSTGATAAFLANGALMATVSSASAAEQVTRAARAALLLKDDWPASLVSMATGRGMIHGRTAIGEVVEQAAQAIKAVPDLAPADARAGIWLDALSAALLEGRFLLEQKSGGILLLGEESGVDLSRPLLGKPTPCVGREVELHTLSAQLGVCIEEPSAQLLLMTGAPGVGKSRLRHEFVSQLKKREEAITLLLGRGDMMNAAAPYGILRSAIQQLCGICGGAALDTQQECLRARVARHLPPAKQERVVLFIAEVCNLPFPPAGRPLLKAAHQDPKIMHDQMRRALLDWLAAECAVAPVLLVLDDLQWGDELTVSLLHEALRELAAAPLCVMGFARPEVYQSFPKFGHGHKMTQIHLAGLSSRACERLSRHVLGKDVAAGLFSQLAEQSGGNALFLEELIRSIATGKSTESSETFLAMLQARIGGLPAGARRAVRAASVFGQTFWDGGLRTLLEPGDRTDTINRWIEILVKEEICEQRSESRFPGQAEYRFRHALIRDAVYALLGVEDRKLGHRLAGQYLEQAGEYDPMILAEHAQRAGELARAVPLYVRAAERSFERSDWKGVHLRVERGIAAGARGEALGTLYAMWFNADFFSGDIANSLSRGLLALELLQRGSRWWCQSIAYLFVACIHQAELGTLNSLVQLLGTVEPSADALAPYIEATSWLVAMFGFLGLREPARSFLHLTRMAIAKETECETNLHGLAQNGHAWYLRNLEPVPYQAMLAARESAQACEVAGNLKTLVTSRLCLAMALSELGDSAAGEKLLRDTLTLPICEEEGMLKGNVQAYLALLLVRREQERDLDEACRLAQRVIEANLSPIYTGVARMVFAHAALVRAQPARAAEEAQQAVELMQPMRPYQLDAQVILIHAWLRSGRISEACALAEEGRNALSLLGGIGYGEVPLRLAVAEARHAGGDLCGAVEAVREACQEVRKRAESIPDPQWRQRFLTQVPGSARTVKLAESWGDSRESHSLILDMNC